MHMKRYESTGTQFFSHYANTGCLHGKGESPAHLSLKQRVHDIAVACGWTATYEHRIETEDSIAIIDILLTSPSGKEKRAVEIQLSRQTDIDYEQRSLLYSRNGITTLWLTRHKAPNRRRIRALQLQVCGKEQEPIEAYTHEDIHLRVPRCKPDMQYTATPTIAAFLEVWLNNRIHFRREVDYNYRVVWAPQGNLDIVTHTTTAVWLSQSDLTQLAKAREEAREELEAERTLEKQRLAKQAEDIITAKRKADENAKRKAAELEAINTAMGETMHRYPAAMLDTYYRDEGMITCDYEPRVESKAPRDKYAHVYRWHPHAMEAAVAKPLSTLAEQLERCLAYNEKRGRTADVETLAWQLGVSEAQITEVYHEHCAS